MFLPLKSAAKIVKYVWDKSLLLLCRHWLNPVALIFLYNIFIFLYRVGIRITALWNVKARSWIDGRRLLFERLQESIDSREPLVWIHSSSAGEFEQAKPVIESLKKTFPAYKILVTFFSPSGYNAAKNYLHADYIFYLPPDTSAHAEKFLRIINPRLVVFVKYDFWYHHLNAIHSKGIPLVLISAVFRKNQLFFKWYGGFYRKMLFFFNHIFVQDDASFQLLNQLEGIRCSVSEDTRFDRVAEIAQNFSEIPYIRKFAGNKSVLVAGSTWPDDERLLKEMIDELPEVKLILAPHEINKAHLNDLKDLFPDAVFYSSLKNENQEGTLNEAGILIIDNVGMLSRLYHYATIAYIGGGFTKDGIHNTLEAAVYGKPVLFGPNYKKYREAKELIEAGGGFTFSRAEELKAKLQTLLTDTNIYQQACEASAQYIAGQQGATKKIMNYIQENRLLTN